ncbi:MAG: DUF2190 family protein [Archaeoglobaceae archaeon]
MALVYESGKFIKATASAAVTAGNVVELTGAETVAPTSSTGSTAVIGVAVNNAAQGGLVTVVTKGVVEVTAAGAISVGALVQSAANGRVASLTLSAVGDVAKIVGKALTAASAAGDKIKILLR